MTTPNHEDLVRLRAYALWEAEGKPDGHDKQHWERAEHELSERADLELSDEPAEPKATGRPTAPTTH